MPAVIDQKPNITITQPTAEEEQTTPSATETQPGLQNKPPQVASTTLAEGTEQEGASTFSSGYTGPPPPPYDPSVPAQSYTQSLTPDQIREGNLGTIRTSLQTYAATHQNSYPTTLPLGSPTDPQTKTPYTYYVADDFKSFTVCATLSTDRFACSDSALTYIIRIRTAAVSQAASDLTSYVDPVNKVYSLQYPRIWKNKSLEASLENWKTAGATLSLAIEDEKGLPLKNASGEDITITQVEATQISAPGNATFDQFVQYFISRAQEQQADPTDTLKEFSYSQTTVAGRAAYKMNYIFKYEGGVQAPSNTYLVKTGEKTGLYLRLTALPSKAFAKFLRGTFDAIVKSVQM
ncbi:MAG: hypothetical protein V4436_00400 [Patescibacteria group bacterium]